MKPLTIAFVTSRTKPLFEWFYDSLINQIQPDDQIYIHIVDTFASERTLKTASDRIQITHFEPKPTVWQGRHKLTKEPWWAKSNSLNSSIILCETPWWASIDDRSVLAPGWLECVRAAMQGNYAVCGSYEKRANLQVQDGIATGGELLGADTRTPGLYDFSSWYGGSGALPLKLSSMILRSKLFRIIDAWVRPFDKRAP